MPQLVDQFSRPAYYTPSSSGLYEDTQEKSLRLSRPALHYDLGDLLSKTKFESIISDARWIFHTFPLVSGSVRQKSQYVSASGWAPKFIGEDEEFEAAALEALKNPLAVSTNRHMSFDQSWRIASQLLDIDGGFFTLRIKNRAGFPITQFIEAHRIGNRVNQATVKASKDLPNSARYDGARIVNGIVYSADGREVAYQVLGSTTLADRIIPAEQMRHHAEWSWFSENRPFPKIAYSALDLYDIKETRNYEKISQKANSAISIIETNETGQNINANAVPGSAAQAISTAGSGIRTETLDAGLVRYIRANSGGSIQAHTSERPGDGALAFDQLIVNGALFGMGWRSEMMDLSRLTGAGVRGFADNINQVIRERHCNVKAMAKQDLLFKIAALMERGDIPAHPEWDKWTFAQPARFDVDRGKTVTSELNELRAGRKSIVSLIEADGGDPEEEMLRQAKHERRKKEIAAQFGLDPAVLGTSSLPGDVLPEESRNTETETDEEETQEDE